MNEMDLLTQFRAEVPLRVSPHAEELFQAGIQDHSSERPEVPAPGNPLARRLFAPSHVRWRVAIAAGAAVALTAGVLAAVLPSSQSSSQSSRQPATLTVKLLADRAAAAALSGPTVPAGQWVLQRMLFSMAGSARITQDNWSTADGTLTDVGAGWGTGPSLYSHLGSLPASPAALDKYLARLSYPNANATKTNDEVAAFSTIEQLLASAILPPALNAELYRALADIPTVTVKSHVTDIAGRAGVAFVMPENSQSSNQEIILDAKNYRYLAQAAWQPSNGSPNSAIPFTETAVLSTTLVAGPDSTVPDSAPPTQATLAAEKATLAVLKASGPGPGLTRIGPDQWIYRKLSTSGGTRDVWATADDTEQASYVDGKLVTCARSAPCASGVTWLMPTGPAYSLVNASSAGPFLPSDPRALLDKLNTYRTGCTDTAGYCDAVGVFANILLGYGNTAFGYGKVGVSPPGWYFSLADVPGVTVSHITDSSGRADVEFTFPFTTGVTGILFNARTYQVAGYIEGGTQTLLLQQANVPHPGTLP